MTTVVLNDPVTSCKLSLIVPNMLPKPRFEYFLLCLFRKHFLTSISLIVHVTSCKRFCHCSEYVIQIRFVNVSNRIIKCVYSVRSENFF